MKTTYRGFEIEVKRENCLGGYEQVYFTTKRVTDGWFLTDSFSDDEDTLETHIQCLKEEVDDFLANPEDYLDPETYRDQLIQQRDEAQVIAAWFFQNYVAIGGLPKDQVRTYRKRYPYLKKTLSLPD